METVELEPTNVRCMEPLEEMISCSHPSAERRQKPQPEQSLNCPRCSSTNTKFCYYNNYSLSQPRYFCKTCRRYWTKGGTLRNVPVGGGCRKNRRPSTSKPVNNKPSSNGTLETHSDLGIDHHGLSSYGQDMIFPFPMIQQYCGYGNGSGSEVLEHKPSPLPSISSAFNGVFEDVGFQNSGSFFYQPLEGVNSYFNQQRIEGGGRVFFPLEDQREDAKPNMFGGFDRKVVNQLTENSSYWNGMGGTWPQLPNYMP